jgi:hypothetical protein
MVMDVKKIVEEKRKTDPKATDFGVPIDSDLMKKIKTFPEDSKKWGLMFN